MGAFGIVKLGVKKERVEIQHIETDVRRKNSQIPNIDRDPKKPAA
jgi:hypothetical protein